MHNAACEEHCDRNHQNGKDDNLGPHNNLVAARNGLPWNDFALHVLLPCWFNYGKEEDTNQRSIGCDHIHNPRVHCKERESHRLELVEAILFLVVGNVDSVVGGDGTTTYSQREKIQ